MERSIHKAAHFVAQHQQMSDEQEAVIAYGMTALCQMLMILLFTVIWGLLTKTIVESLIVYAVVGGFRKFTGGVHAKTLWGCIAVSVITISLMSVLSRYVLAPQMTSSIMLTAILILFGLVFSIVWRRAPVESPNKPIRKPEKIKRLRIGSLIILSVLMTVCILVSVIAASINSLVLYSLIWSMILALLWQGFTLTGLAKLLFH